jgi:hypothetical protein
MRMETKKRLEDKPMILKCLQAIESATRVGAHRQDMWDRCWKDTNDPRYFSDILRINGEFWFAPGAEREHLNELRSWLFAKYLDGIDTVHEFGCGSGQNLKALQGKKNIVGYDWSPAAVDRINAMGGKGILFDMFKPDDVEIKGAILTVHAMEQLGNYWDKFLDLLLSQRPAICIHIEPVEEFYDPEDCLDYLSLAYHKKRGYLAGYLTHLRALERMGIINILEARRTHAGGLYHEAYSVIVWR